MNPFDRLLDSLEWKSLLDIAQEADDLPHATHEAILDIMGRRLRVYQLSNGQRVIHAGDFESFFKGLVV